MDKVRKFIFFYKIDKKKYFINGGLQYFMWKHIKISHNKVI